MADLTLDASEQRAILENPEGVMLLMNWHDYQQTCADAMGAECHGNQLRHDELKAHGRAIVLKDPEIWSDEVLRAFGVTRGVAPCAAPSREQRLERALADMEKRKDGAYEERNKVVAALAKVFPSGLARTAIEGWSEDWHGCVYIDLPTGQVSWHFHDSQAHLFAGLPPYSKPWDGHDTPEKYRRLAALGVTAVDPLDRAKQIRERVAELEAELQRLIAEHETLTGGPWGKPDAEDMAWATGKDDGAEWQPIETAPLNTDGVWLMVDGAVVRGIWCEQEFREHRDTDGTYLGQQDADAFWLDLEAGDRCEPTHWQPIVKPTAAGVALPVGGRQ